MLAWAEERPWAWRGAAAAAAIAIFLLNILSPVSETGSDARFSLFTTQAILDAGTFKLDSFEELIPIRQYDYRLLNAGGHIFYNFPLGSSIFSIPFVWSANRLGIRILTTGVEDTGLNLIAAAVTTGLFLLLVGIGEIYLPRLPALGLAVVVMLGSSLTSSLATSLWSLNFTLFFYAFCLWLVIRLERGKSETVHPVFVGFGLFAAYLCRPTAAVFILLTFAYLLIRNRREFGVTAVTAFTLLVIFGLVTRYEIGAWLLPYYIPSRLEGAGSSLWLVLYGLLLSPGRGLFVFSPIFLIPIVVLPREWHKWRQNPIFWLAVIWIGLHILIVAGFRSWWGGFSFGPRLLTDIVPAFYLLLLLWARDAIRGDKMRWRPLLTGLFVFFAAISIVINSVSGLFNPQTKAWNGSSLLPNIDNATEYLLDWHFPQFLASAASNCARNQDFHRQVLTDGLINLTPYPTGMKITSQEAGNGRFIKLPPPGQEQPSELDPASPLFHKLYLPFAAQSYPKYAWMTGWYLPGENGVRPICHDVEIAFGPYAYSPPDTGEFVVSAGVVKPVTINLRLNQVDLGNIHLRPETANYRLSFPGSTLHLDRINTLQIHSEGNGRLVDNFQFKSVTINSH